MSMTQLLPKWKTKGAGDTRNLQCWEVRNPARAEKGRNEDSSSDGPLQQMLGFWDADSQTKRKNWTAEVLVLLCQVGASWSLCECE